MTSLAPSLTWHYRWVATNSLGTTFSPDQTFNVGTPGANVLSGVLGDANGDGIVSQAELDAVYASYVTNSPWLYMTNVAASAPLQNAGNTIITFKLDMSVQVTTGNFRSGTDSVAVRRRPASLARILLVDKVHR